MDGWPYAKNASACNASRAAFQDAAQCHMLALQASIQNGMQLEELRHDIDAFHNAARQLLALAATADGPGPAAFR